MTRQFRTLSLMATLTLGIGVQLATAEEPSRRTSLDKDGMSRTFANDNPRYGEPVVTCAGATDHTLTVQICADSVTGAQAGFTLQWETCDQLAADGGIWGAKVEDGGPLCHGSFSGNANSTLWNLNPGQCKSLTIGELTEVLLPSSGTSFPLECDFAECDTCYVFRSFAHAKPPLQRSNFSPNVECTTEPCKPPDGFPPYCSYTMGGYGGGGEPADLLEAAFPTLYPAGLSLGGTFVMKFTTFAKVNDYLPCGGNATVLTANKTDQACSTATGRNLGGQTTTLKINVDMNTGFLPPYGDIELCNYTTSVALSGTLLTAAQVAAMNGQTVSQVLAAAEAYLGGGGALSPYGLSNGQVVALLTSLNEAFDNCVEDLGHTTFLCLP